MKRTAALLAALAAAGALTATTLPAAPAAAAACSATWGSLDKSAGTLSSATITDLRAGRHACFDRLVVDLDGKVQGYWASYGAVIEPSGERVPLRGTDLHLEVFAPAHDGDYRPTYSPADKREAVDVGGYRTFRQVAWVGTFEGQSTIGLGLRARLPYRVQIVDGPGTGSRLVLDVAHSW